MGVGYQASALHRITYLDMEAAGPFTSEPPPGFPAPPIPNARYAINPPVLRSPAAAEIIAWRDRLAAKYRGQLDEILTWDEGSDFQTSDDVAVGCDVCVRYVAAIVEESGPQAIRRLIDTDKPAPNEIERAFSSVEREGFSGPFPQLKLVSAIWLPFQCNMVIEEPDWRNKIERYGSTYRLADELEELRGLIKGADPRSVEWDERRDPPTKTLWAAWQASQTIVRICKTANSLHFPFWTTG